MGTKAKSNAYDLNLILERIDRRLAVLDISDAAASRAAGMSSSYIRNFRRAVAGEIKVTSPRLDALAKIAAALKTNLPWLAIGFGVEEGEAESAELREIFEKLRNADPSVQKKTFQFIDLMSD